MPSGRGISASNSAGGPIWLRALEIAANATFSRNRFVRHTDYSTGTPVALDGNPIAGFPDLLANVRLTYRLEQLDPVGSRPDMWENSTPTISAMRTIRSIRSSSAMARASYTFEQLVNDVDVEARMQVNNLFDVLYAAYGEGTQFFVGAERQLRCFT